MDIVNLPFFYTLGHQLHSLAISHVNSQARINILLSGMHVQESLQALLQSYSDVSALRTSFNTLRAAVDQCRQWAGETPTERWGDKDAVADSRFLAIVHACSDCETVLLAELPNVTTYHPRQKGIYDTQRLVSQAEQSLPPHVLDRMNAVATAELRQAGQCLAFDLPTASGFHMMRATEAILHEYYLAVCKPSNKKTLENWGAYLAALDKYVKQKDDAGVKEVMAILQQMKDSHRNLIMHPEVVLSEDEAHTLFEVSKGAIIAMGQRLKAKRQPS